MQALTQQVEKTAQLQIQVDSLTQEIVSLREAAHTTRREGENFQERVIDLETKYWSTQMELKKSHASALFSLHIETQVLRVLHICGMVLYYTYFP